MRRMINTKITDNDLFLDMPPTARLLYYDLLIRADDDGFITPQRIIRMTGATPDDLKILIAKHFVYQWQDGVIVLLHWREHNHVKSDRYQSSDYAPRLRQIAKLYALGLRDYGSKMVTKRLHDGSKMVPQDRVGKEKLKKKIEKESLSPLKNPDFEEIATHLNVEVLAVQNKWRDLQEYCAIHGKTYKDYNLALQRWLRQDIATGKIAVKKPVVTFVPPAGEAASETTRLAAVNQIRSTLSEKFAL